MSNPFRSETSSSAVDQWRKRRTIALLREEPRHFGRVLEIGPADPFTGHLVSELGLQSIENTSFDLNSPPRSNNQYDSVFCFEIIEHIQNPLLLLAWIRDQLAWNGTLYLTTPIGGFPSVLMWPKTHYHEIDEYRLRSLYALSCLRLERIARFRAPAHVYLRTGILRPLLRSIWGGWFYAVAGRQAA